MGDAPARVGGATAADAALDRFFAMFYRQRPVTATFTGIHTHDGVLPDWSPAGLAAAADEMREARRALDAAGRVPDERVRAFPHDVDLALADAALEIALAEHDSGHFVHANPSMWTGEALFGVLGLVTREFAPLSERLAHAQSRLEAIPAFLASARLTMAGAPLEWKSRAKRECQVALPLLSDRLPAWVRASESPGGAAHGAIDEAAWTCASRAAAAAFGEFEVWLDLVEPSPPTRSLADLLPSWPTSSPLPRTGLASAPDEREQVGGELLSLLLRRGHWTTAPIAALLVEAREALDDAVARLDAMSRPHGGWPAVQALLASEHPTADGYLARFEERWLACWKAAHDFHLVSWPLAPLRYVAYPEHVAAAAPHLYYLHYRSPAPFDPFGTFNYVVPGLGGLTPDEIDARLRQWNDSVITLNHVVHHGGIGHHVQNHHAYRAASRIGQVAAVDAANRIAMFSGGSLAEGWACYVCDLMEEIGFLTPLERIAQQHTRVRIAARAVVDLALHTGQLTAPKAVSLYAERAWMSPAAARAESVRNSMYPGTAVMYWLGAREIHRVRAEVWAREGETFSMRRFHDRLLSYGAIPVPLISKLMLAEEPTS